MTVVYTALADFVVILAPTVSFAVSELKFSNCRRSCKRAAQRIVYGLSTSVVVVVIAEMTALYVTFSDQISGFAGVAINGKGRWHDDAGVVTRLTRVSGRLSVQASYTRLFNSGFEAAYNVLSEGKCLAAPSTSPECLCYCSRSRPPRRSSTCWRCEW
jgi:hypothetical protein